MTHEVPNSIILGSLTYIIDGRVTVQPASAWAEGIRSGSPDYGDINHAHFRVTEDFRGGMGVKFGKDREDLDVMAESEGVRTWLTRNGFDLAPILTQGTIGAISPSYNQRNFPMQEHIVRAQNYLWGAAGNTVMRYGSTAGTWVNDSPSGIAVSGANGINNAYCLYEYINTNGSVHLYWGAGYVSSNLNRTDVDYYRRDESVAVADVTAWAQPTAGEKAHDFLEFDKKLLKIYFGQIKSSEDGATWTDINIDIPNPPSRLSSHRSKFVGRVETVSGELMPVVLRSRKLYWVDIFAQDYAEIETGMSLVVDATVYQDEIAATDNHSVKLIHPRRPVRDIGLPSMKDSILTDTSKLSPAFLKLMTWGPYLLALVNMSKSGVQNSQLWLFNGSGWHSISFTLNGTVNNTINGGNSGLASYIGQDPVVSGKEIWAMVAVSEGSVPLVYQIPTAATLLHDTLTPHFSGTGQVITPWFSGGFKNMIGTAIELTLSSRDLDATNEEIQIEYQIDGNESAWLSTALGDPTGNGAGVFTVSPQETIKFGTATAGSGQGIKFEDIRFKISISRGSTVTKTPVFLGLVLSYIKTPKLRRRYQFSVDVAATAQHREPVASGTRITYESIVDELYGFIDDDPLTPFSYTNESLKWVRIIGMPRQDALAPPADDNYSRVQVDLIEPVGV